MKQVMYVHNLKKKNRISSKSYTSIFYISKSFSPLQLKNCYRIKCTHYTKPNLKKTKTQ